MPTLKCPISGAEVEVSTVEPGASGWTPNHRHDLVLVVDGAPVAVRERDVARDAIKHGRAWEFGPVEAHPESHAKKEVAEVAEVAEVKKALAEELPLEVATPVDLGSNTHEAVDDVFGEPAVVDDLDAEPPPPPREPTPHAVHPRGRKRKS